MKPICVFLSLLILLSLFSCRAKVENPPPETGDTASAADETKTPDLTTDAPETTAPETVPEETEPPETEPETEAAPPETEAHIETEAETEKADPLPETDPVETDPPETLPPPEPTPEPEPVPPSEEHEYLFVPIPTLLGEVKSNAFRAKTTYGDKFVETAGNLSTIDGDGKYFLLADYGTSFSLQTIKCNLTDPSQLEILATLNTGVPVTVKGKITQVDGFNDYTMDLEEISLTETDLLSWIDRPKEELHGQYNFKSTESSRSEGDVLIDLFGHQTGIMTWYTDGKCSLSIGYASVDSDDDAAELYTTLFALLRGLYGDPTFTKAKTSPLSDLRDDIREIDGDLDSEWIIDNYLVFDLLYYKETDAFMILLANPAGINLFKSLDFGG